MQEVRVASGHLLKSPFRSRERCHCLHCECTSRFTAADVDHAWLQEAVVPFNHLEIPCGAAEVWRFACSNPCMADERKSTEECESPPILFSQAQGKLYFPDIYCSHFTRDKLQVFLCAERSDCPGCLVYIICCPPITQKMMVPGEK